MMNSTLAVMVINQWEMKTTYKREIEGNNNNNRKLLFYFGIIFVRCIQHLKNAPDAKPIE